MKLQQRKLQLVQLDRKIGVFLRLKTVSRPGSGWISAVRVALGISLKQLGSKLEMSPQGVKDIERREAEGSITLNSLQDTAAALDMQLVYGLIPKEETLEKMVEKRARRLAIRIVQRTSQTMHLEGQGISAEDLERAVTERTAEIISKMPRHLWD